MKKVSYRPGRNQNCHEVKKLEAKGQSFNEPLVVTEKLTCESMQEGKERIGVISSERNCHNIESTKIIGDLDCEYHVYIEDYVYTYLYQLAASDLTKESAAMLIGEIYLDSKEAIIRAAIPVDGDKLKEGSEWIDMSITQEIEMQRRNYFPDQQIIGWMHMQPGYGTMLTMKELREHQSVFEGNGTICMLMDAINKIETIYVYEDEELKEQSGYCMYYERNEEMQQFMLDHPFAAIAKEKMKDTVVNQFREIGKIRKAEYAQRKSLNLTVMAASIILIALTAVIVKMNDNKKYIDASSTSTSAKIDRTQESGSPQEQYAFLDEAALDTISNDSEGLANVSIQEGTQETEANVMEEQIEEANEPSAEDNIEDSDHANEYSTYIVASGDTLADICYKEYGSAERSMEVAKFNNLSNTNQIYVGQELKIPK